jgi:CDP-2,3-bis-(O-geranylgeranyl)-sn-glycerol synthase
MNHYLFALIFFLPAGIANAAPLLINKVPLLNQWKTPIDFGMHVRGKRMLGPNKTWRGLFFGMLAGGLTGLLVYPLLNSDINNSFIHFLIGGTLGFGALFGDAMESFFKRQMNIPSGNSWILFDQLDYVLGAILFSLPFVLLRPIDYFVIVLTYFVLHFIVTYIGFLLHFKEKPI